MGMFSGLFGGGGTAKRAAQVAAEKEAEAGRLVDQRYQDVSKFYQPYQDAGTAALGSYQTTAATLPQYTDRINQYAASMDPVMAKIQSTNLNDYQSSPGYDFRFQQGQRALEASRAAKGLSGSGATDKALLEYGQGIGSAEYQNYLGNLYNQLGGIGTQIGGVQAGQQSAQGTLDAYGNLITTGLNASNSNAQLGMSAAEQQAQRIANTGQIYAGGMMAKDAQLKSAGDQWIKMGAMAAGGALGGVGGAQMAGQMAPSFAGSGGQQYGATQPQTQQYGQLQQSFLGGFSEGYNNSNAYSMQPGVNMGAYQPMQQAQPWQNPDAGTPPQLAQLGMQAGYRIQPKVFA